MDPTNNNPVAPNPAAPNPAPVNPAPVSPAPAVAPTSPAPAAAPAVAAGPAPAAGLAGSAPAAPVASNPAPAASVNADVANAALNPPVNPVVTPGANMATKANVGATMPMNQMFQPQPATQADVFDETTAIAVPEGPKPPDPVEEELKAPLKAAGPVPGSIGSAVSMPPADGSQPQNNGVNEQMMANGINPMAANANAPAGKKPNIFDKLTAKTKMNKNTLIILSVVAGLVVVALVVVLIMVATGAL